MIIISKSLSLSSQAILDANSPAVGWKNLVTRESLYSQSNHPEHPVVNLANPATNLRWESLIATEQVVGTEVLELGPIDYVGIARHNFGSINAVLQIEATDGFNWEVIVPQFILPTDAPAIIRFPPRVVTGLRLRIMPQENVPPRMAVMYVGKLLLLERHIYVGHTPFPFGRTSRVTNGKSESGEFLGRIVLSESKATKVTLQNLTPTWYRVYMDPFIAASKEDPFFFAWRPGSYPLEVGYGWMTNNPQPVNQRPNGMMQIALEMNGLAL